MNITWLGHAAFLIETEDGKKILTDPYEAGSYDGALAYRPIEEEADVVTVSHEHADHFDQKGLKGHPDIVRGPGTQTVKGISIRGIPTFHDPSDGQERGENTIHVIEVEGMTICHFGDLGHGLNDEQISAIGPVDVALIPVGGFYTIDAREATEIIAKMAPKIVIPMHFKTAACAFPIAPVDDFLKGKDHVERTGSSELSLTKDRLPSDTHIHVLEHKL